MAIDLQGQGGDLAGRRFVDLWREPAVDDTGRQMPQKVDDPRPGQFFDQPRGFRADAGKLVHIGEKRIEDLRTHQSDSISCPRS